MRRLNLVFQYVDGFLSASPSGEREIKRLVRSPKTDSTCGSVYPWTYYLLGTNDEQQVVYHGRQISRADCDAGGIGRRVFFYPVEYRSYGVDGVNIVWERDANGAMVARFVGSDIQGSERYTVGKNAYQKVRDYLPFGVDVAVANDQRRGYLGKESDYETAPKYGVVHAGLYHERLMDMSARKYSKTQGAFTSVDELWRGQMDYSPYAYSFHDPINFMDPSGMAGGGNNGGGDGTTDASQPGRNGVYIWTGSGVSPFQLIQGFTESEARSKRLEADLIASMKRLGDFMGQYSQLVQQPQPIDKYTHPDYKYSQPSSTQVSMYPGTWDPTELLHLGLDFLGFAPGIVGVIADAVNGLLYLVEGEFKAGGLTLLAVIPGLDGMKGIRFVSKSSGKLLAQFSASTIEEAVSYAMRTKATHIFKKAAHNLDPLVAKLGSQESTLRAVLNAANGKLPPSGVFEDVMVTVQGYNVFLRGSVVDGVPKLGTMFIK